MSDTTLVGDTARVIGEVSSFASDVDCNADHDARIMIKKLAEDGLLDLGLPGSAGTYSDQIRVLEDLASVCMTTAFTAWSHRMTTEYLVVHGGDAVRTASVRRADRVGSTALAGTFRAAAGVSEIPVNLEREGSSTGAHGFLSWASNLHSNAVVVTGVQDSAIGQRRLISFDVEAHGVEVIPVTGLLALDGTKSGALRLTDVEVREEQFLHTPFADFIADVRPKFLLFQTAFVLGLVSGSLSAIHDLRGPAQSLSESVDGARCSLVELRSTLESGGRDLDRGRRPDLRTCLELRLDASHLATTSTQLELATRGGSGYLHQSATARRVREALFLPVQSPTEAQLRWELEVAR